MFSVFKENEKYAFCPSFLQMFTVVHLHLFIEIKLFC